MKEENRYKDKTDDNIDSCCIVVLTYISIQKKKQIQLLQQKKVN
jgi:hypothetical protein